MLNNSININKTNNHLSPLLTGHNNDHDLYIQVLVIFSAGFTYRLDRLRPRASQFRGPPAKVYNIFNTVIGVPDLDKERA
jgi:hypothetical protein